MKRQIEKELSCNMKDVVSSIGKILEESKMTMTAVITSKKRVEDNVTAKARGVVGFGEQNVYFDNLIRDLIIDSAKVLGENEMDDDNILSCNQALSKAIIKNPLLLALTAKAISDLRKNNPELIVAAQAILDLVAGANDVFENLNDFDKMEEPEGEVTH